MNQIGEMLLTIAMGVIGVALLSVIVSKNSNTAGVIQAAASGFGNSLDVAISPVTGKAVAPNLAYPTSGFAGGSGGYVNMYG